MPPEHALEDALSWVRKASDDLQSAKLLQRSDPPVLTSALFHAQQTVEKGLKALLTWHDQPFRKTHDLAELGRACVEVDATLATLCREAERLTVYAWIFRYPGEPEEPDSAEALGAVDLAERVLSAIVERVQPEDRSAEDQ